MWYLRVDLARLVADLDQRLLLLVRRLSTTIFRDRPVTSSTSSWIRDVGDEVLVLHRARILGEDRERVRIPLDQDLPGSTVLRRRAP